MQNIKYKPFKEKMKECVFNGNLIEVDLSIMKTGIALICVKNKEICRSGVCYLERLQE